MPELEHEPQRGRDVQHDEGGPMVVVEEGGEPGGVGAGQGAEVGPGGAPLVLHGAEDGEREGVEGEHQHESAEGAAGFDAEGERESGGGEAAEAGEDAQ